MKDLRDISIVISLQGLVGPHTIPNFFLCKQFNMDKFLFCNSLWLIYGILRGFYVDERYTDLSTDNYTSSEYVSIGSILRVIN